MLQAAAVTGLFNKKCGYSLVELMIAVAIAGLLVTATSSVIGQVNLTSDFVHERTELTRDARFAMQRMVNAVSHSRLLMLPLADNPATTWRENVREQTVPASPPEPGSMLASAVLAVTQDTVVDIDGNGVADADNDNDGRVDEDLPGDVTNDGASGIVGIDDDGDGLTDETNKNDDDEDEDLAGNRDEESQNGLDDDGDGAIDEDLSADMNKDGEAGVAGLDDDSDGFTDETNQDDDDEDEDQTGKKDEDWFDPVVFHLQGGTLMVRTPLPYDVGGDAIVNGLDFLESPLAENISRFRVERVPVSSGGDVLVDLTLELTGTNGDPISLSTRVRVGAAL